MKNSPLNSFLTHYVGSLYERTRQEKKGLNIGFDWVVYQLGLARDWIPLRLPFYRQMHEGVSKPKSEPEFGIDLSFLLPSKKDLYIFVLKDEQLTYGNWTNHNFDKDLRMAASPDLSQPELDGIERVKIVLAYNKDENDSGVRAFENLVKALPSKIYDTVDLEFERWNLTRLVEEIKEDLLTPDLLPQHLSEHFRYICSQIRDFDFGTEQWESQLVNNWKSFLSILLSDPDERKVRLLPVVLLIARDHAKDAPSSQIGWIDLAEWAMLALWDCYKCIDDARIRQIVLQIWIQFYIFQLELYFQDIDKVFTTQHAFVTIEAAPNGRLSAMNDAYMAFWHLGRLGILALAPQEVEPRITELLDQVVTRSADWLVSCFQANPASMRPLLDLHHIELYLAWLVLWQARREDDIYQWLSELEQRLILRRVNEKSIFPFIESNSRMDLLTEYAIAGERPDDYSDSSSYLLLMLLELICALPVEKRDKLLRRYHSRLIRGIEDSGERIVEEQINLVSWVPPDDWAQRVLRESVRDGVAITTDGFAPDSGEKGSHQTGRIDSQIQTLVDSTRQRFPWQLPTDIPQSAYILACIKNRSPLPPEFWRSLIFVQDAKTDDNAHPAD